jgi:TnpA family transposase
MYRHLFLSAAQREAIETAHFDLDDREVARHWTLSEQDLVRIDRRRRDSNRFGFAVQLCLLRFPGWPPKRRGRVPSQLLRYLGEQLGIETENIEEYFDRHPLGPNIGKRSKIFMGSVNMTSGWEMSLRNG